MEFDSCNVTSYKPPFNILDQIWLYLLMKDSTYSYKLFFFAMETD